MADLDRVIRTDAVVVGTGVAGLTTALSLRGFDVALVTKTALGGGSTWWAQGGIAAAISAEDSPRLHAGDTLAVGAGLNDPGAVALLAENAVAGIRMLLERGARFDVDEAGRPVLGREAGHSVRRILHADGDATGAEVSRALAAAAAGADHLEVHEHTFVTDLVVDGGRVVGVTARTGAGERIAILAGSVVLATGGIGRAYANTTNPVEVTGDGMAMAARAGARIGDAEFVQFHPTALDAGVDPMPLLTEALRGEGATLIDDAGERFMPGEHPDAELAPRDVVARAVWRRIRSGRKVFLDATAAIGDDLPERFPTVDRLCRAAGIDPTRDPVPVAPAAHYHMGGIAVGLTGRSTLPGLWAVGEASRTGVHGANRLASNSLLEGLVFGESVASDIAGVGASASVRVGEIADPGPNPEPTPDAVAAVRGAMWEGVGLVRDADSLRGALKTIGRVTARLPAASGEARNLAEVAAIVAEAALARTESRGAHFRSDHPHPDETHLETAR